MNKKIVILISGKGSNLQAFIDIQNRGGLSGVIIAVISNKPDVYGLERARTAGIAAETLDHRNFDSRENFDHSLAKLIDGYEPDLIILAGFMRILTANFVTNYRGKILNIHPSLLPKYPGLNTHKQALENGDAMHGASVHFVTTGLDEGPIIAQSQFQIAEDESEDSLVKKVQKLEHVLFPKTVNLFLTGKIRLKKDIVYFEDKPLHKALLF